ncbi:hypothetical protein ACROYT_G003823 [Oculina patagonica]
MAAINAIGQIILCCLFLPSVRGAVCRDPPAIRNGQVRTESKAGNITAYYTCNKGFVNVGGEKLFCLPSGKWKKTKIKCVPACQPPAIPPNAVITKPKSQYTKGDLVWYSCKPGYRRLAGLVFVKCLGGTWTKVTFKCVVSKDCKSPEVPENGEKFGSEFSVGKRVSYTCDTGFVLQGSIVIECLKNRTWSAEVPLCKVVDCGSLPDPAHGRKTRETKTTFGGRADFICKKKRYSLIGSRSRLCQADGKWSGTTAVCKAPCSDPGKPTGGRRIGNNFRHRKQVTFRCSKSLKIQGPRRIICFDGTWSDRKPKCLPPSQVKDYSECGMRSKSRRSRMVGGVESVHGMWPWQAGLYRLDQTIGKKQFLCGAALIARQWIVTAAHCFMYRHADDHVKQPLTSPPEMYKIVVGDRARDIEEDSQRTLFATRIILHPRYHDDFKENDIALVRLSTKVTLTRYVRKVCLPESANSSIYDDIVTKGSQGFVAGWGSTQVLNPGETADADNSSSTVLNSAQFHVQDTELCRNSTDYHFNESLKFCAGSDRHGVGPCTGDSGGPFVIKMLHGGARKWVAVGLVSWGEGCGIYGRYTFYTKLAPYVNWISKHTSR